MKENNTERAYTAKLKIEISNGVFAPRTISREITIERGTKEEFDAVLASLSKSLRLNLLVSFRDWRYLITEGWRHFLTSGNDG